MDRLGAHERILKAAEDRLDRDPVPLPSVQPPHSLGLELTHVPTVHQQFTRAIRTASATDVTYGTENTNLVYCTSRAEYRQPRYGQWRVGSVILNVPKLSLLLGAEFARQFDKRRYAPVTPLDRLFTAILDASGLERVVQIHHGCVIYRDDAAEVRKSAARGPTLSENHTRTARPFWHTVEEVPTPGHAPHGGENMTRYSDFSKDAATALETLMRARRSDGSGISQGIFNLSETAASNPQSVAVGSCSRDSMLGSKLGYSPAT